MRRQRASTFEGSRGDTAAVGRRAAHAGRAVASAGRRSLGVAWPAGGGGAAKRVCIHGDPGGVAHFRCGRSDADLTSSLVFRVLAISMLYQDPPQGVAAIRPDELMERLLCTLRGKRVKRPSPCDACSAYCGRSVPHAAHVPSMHLVHSLPDDAAVTEGPYDPSWVDAPPPAQGHAPEAGGSLSAPSSPVMSARRIQSKAEELTRVPFQSRSTVPVLLLDTRPAHIFQGCVDTSDMLDGSDDVRTGHLKGAINVQIPTLLFRRTQRALTSSPALLDSIDIASYIQSEAGRRKLRSMCRAQELPPASKAVDPAVLNELIRVFWFMDIVVLYEDRASSFAAYLLLRTIAAIRARASERAPPELTSRRCGLYHVLGGVRGLRENPAWLPFFEVGDSYVEQEDRETAPIEELALPGSGCDARARRPPLPRLNTSVSDVTPAPSLSSGTEGALSRPLTAGLYVMTDRAEPLWDAPRTAREPEEAAADFEVSTIVPGQLYLGSHIQTPADARQLEALGIRAVLNTAAELPLSQEDPHSPMSVLRDTSIRDYLHIPMRDVVEAVGVQQQLRDACRFLERMRACGRPTFVHCRAGKSRSATCVMAYLIQTRRWTLKQAYAFVSAQRPRTSPNIGLMAELMHFERAVLGSSLSMCVSPQRGDAPRTPDSVR